jgi:hypothetical protein
VFVPRALSKESQDRVRALLGTGLGDDEISERTGVGRATVRRWRRRGFPAPTVPVTFQPDRWGTDRRGTYAYLLGQYLGDGYVALLGESSSFVLACDAGYPAIINECCAAISSFAPHAPALAPPPDTKGTRIVSYWAGWRLLFPQHGAGPKHEREIRLEDWQQEIVGEHPRALIRGLIHSDGSRCLNTFSVELKDGPKQYSYPRYFFTNYSADIRGIFCDACDRLGIRWSRSNWRNISISHRRSVALLDSFVGPKS